MNKRKFIKELNGQKKLNIYKVAWCAKNTCVEQSTRSLKEKKTTISGSQSWQLPSRNLNELTRFQWINQGNSRLD